jgi:hypothetical protein
MGLETDLQNRDKLPTGAFFTLDEEVLTI